MSMSRWVEVVALAGALQATAAMAEVTKAVPGQFEITLKAHVAAEPDKTYAAVAKLGQWWSSGHTFSGDAHNLTLEPNAGGCWCEALPRGGSVQHMRVIFAAPGKTLRLSGALGPMQDQPATGVMTWSFAKAAGGTDVTLIYRVAGPLGEGVDWPPLVNSVLGEQFGRFTRFVDTGSPEVKKP